jgi:prepilin-type processing-associated H-X9-DG protein
MNHFKIQKTELLFVVICLFISICCFHAVAYRSREHAKETVCAEYIRLNSQALLGYAGDHDGNVMINGYATWAQDFSFSATDKLISYGANRQAFYCPAKKSFNAFDPRFWQYSLYASQSPNPGPGLGNYQDLVEPSAAASRAGNFRIIAYTFLVDLSSPYTRPLITGQPSRSWIRDIDDISNPSEYEMVFDNTIASSSVGPFDKVMGGLWALYAIYDSTNHLAKNGKPLGGNIGYVDGHIAWKPFTQMQIRCQSGPIFWW